MEQSVSEPVKLAFTVSSYRLCDFVNLSLNQLRRLAPDAPLLVSDDAAPESGHIQQLALIHGASYLGARVRRSHFAGDYQSLVSSLAFAEAAGCDVAVKMSQRLILRTPEAISVIQKAFSDPNICLATPGQPTTSGGAHRGFGAFTTLSDIVMIRVGCLTPKELIHMYRDRLLRDKAPWASFIEIAVDDLHRRFAGRTVKIPELTNPGPNPCYLRRYQASEQDYRNLAATHGMGGMFPLQEWGTIEGRNYISRPLVV